MRAYDFEYQIDGRPMLVPDQDVDIGLTDLDSDDTGRDESGYMHREVLRRKVPTWSFYYAVLSREEYRYIMSLFGDKDDFLFKFRDLDDKEVEYRCYCSKTSITLHDRSAGTYKKGC